MAITQAVVLCGGRGTRLGATTHDLPKPMVAVGGRPVLDHVIANLAAGGVRSFVLAAGQLGHLIADHYAVGANPGRLCGGSGDRDRGARHGGCGGGVGGAVGRGFCSGLWGRVSRFRRRGVSGVLTLYPTSRSRCRR